MDFSDKEMKVLLQALYRFRGEVSGASQSEQNQLSVVSSIIDKIEGKVGPIKAERTRFDREMEESLSVLKTGKMGASKAKGALAEADTAQKLDKVEAPPKVKKASPRKAGGEAPKSATKKAAPEKPAKSTKTRSK